MGFTIGNVQQDLSCAKETYNKIYLVAHQEFYDCEIDATYFGNDSRPDC